MGLVEVEPCVRVQCAYTVSVTSVTSVTEVTGGQKCDKKFLLHESIDLVELYPTVPLRQIVRRGKHFSRSLEVVARLGFVHQYCTLSEYAKGPTERFKAVDVTVRSLELCRTLDRCAPDGS